MDFFYFIFYFAGLSVRNIHSLFVVLFYYDTVAVIFDV